MTLYRTHKDSVRLSVSYFVLVDQVLNSRDPLTLVVLCYYHIKGMIAKDTSSISYTVSVIVRWIHIVDAR